MGLFDKIINSALQPVRDVVNVADGLLEGEIREDAAARLATEALMTLAVGAAIKGLKDD